MSGSNPFRRRQPAQQLDSEASNQRDDEVARATTRFPALDTGNFPNLSVVIRFQCF